MIFDRISNTWCSIRYLYGNAKDEHNTKAQNLLLFRLTHEVRKKITFLFLVSVILTTQGTCEPNNYHLPTANIPLAQSQRGSAETMP